MTIGGRGGGVAWMVALALALGVAASGCGGGAGAHDGPSYPAAPYGGDVGSTLPDFTVAGYLRPEAVAGRASDGTFGSFSLATIRRSGKRLLVMHLGGLACVPCQVAARTMAKRAPALVPAGAFLLEVLAERAGPTTAPDRRDLDAFIAGIGTPYSAALDRQRDEAPMEVYFGVPVDTWLLVELPSMRLAKTLQATGDAVADEVAARLAAPR